MKKKNTLLIVSTLALAGIIIPLTSCKNKDNHKNDPDTDVTVQESTIKFNLTGVKEGQVKVLYDKQTFEPGDEINFSLQTEKDIVIETVKFNGSKLTLTSNNSYKVILKKGENTLDVDAKFMGVIKPTKDGDFVLLFTNGPELVMNKVGDGVYESDDVKLTKDTKFGIYEKLSGGFKTYSSFSQVDKTKTFAGLSRSVTTSGPERDLTLELPGGATYKFIFDKNEDKPISIIRKSVDELPEDADRLHTLLDSEVGTGGETFNFNNTVKSSKFEVKTNLPQVGLYTETSSFNRYENNVSESKFTWTRDGEKVGQKLSGESFMYNQIKDGILYTIDTLPDVVGNDQNVNPFSAKYKIVPAKSGYKAYKRTDSEAAYQVAQPTRHVGHVGSIISPVISYLNGTDDGINITSTKNETGFETTFKSRKITKVSVGGFDSQIALLTNGKLTFTNNGSLLTADVKTMQYDSTTYDFNNLTIKEGKESEGVEYLKLTAAYTYGLDSLEAAPSTTADYLDTYFVKEIKDVVLKEEGIDEIGNHLYPKTVINFASKESSPIMKITFAPETALDKEQYGIISSSNTSVVDNNNGSTREYITKKNNGVSTLKFGNYADNGVTFETKVTVHNTIPLKYIYISDPYAPISYTYNDQRMNGTTNHRLLVAGEIYKIHLDSSPYDANVSNIIINSIGGTLVENEPSLKNYITLSFENTDDMYLKIDLSSLAMNKKIIEPEKLSIAFSGANYASGYLAESSTMTFDVMPNYEKSDLYGTWESKTMSSDNSTKLSAKLIINEDSITVESPESFKQHEIEQNPVFTSSKEGEPWDVLHGSYAIHVMGTTDYSDPTKVTGFDFSTFYYNPFTKKITCHMLYTVWAGLEAESYSIVGFDGTGDNDFAPEDFVKVA